MVKESLWRSFCKILLHIFLPQSHSSTGYTSSQKLVEEVQGVLLPLLSCSEERQCLCSQQWCLRARANAWGGLARFSLQHFLLCQGQGGTCDCRDKQRGAMVHLFPHLFLQQGRASLRSALLQKVLCCPRFAVLLASHGSLFSFFGCSLFCMSD